MASTLLESTRQAHEDIERLERLIVKDFKVGWRGDARVLKYLSLSVGPGRQRGKY